MNKQKSPHILNTSSNLLGFTFIVLSSIKNLGINNEIFVDKILALGIAVLAMSCLLSFVSIRSATEIGTLKYESYAEKIFMVGLFVVALTSILIAFNITGFI